jgi:hypothetical protein
MQVAEVAETNGGWTGTTVQESLSTRYRLVVATGRVCWDALADAIDALQWEEMRPAGTTWAKSGQGWSVRPATTAHGGAVVDRMGTPGVNQINPNEPSKISRYQVATQRPTTGGGVVGNPFDLT